MSQTSNSTKSIMLLNILIGLSIFLAIGALMLPFCRKEVPPTPTVTLTAEQIDALARLASARQHCVESLTAILSHEQPKASFESIVSQVNDVCLNPHK